MSMIRWVALLISVVIYRVWAPEPPLPGAMHLHYDLMLIALIGLHRGMLSGTVWGWIIGFLSAAPDPAMLGWNSMIGAVLGWLVGYWGERMFLEVALSRWLILWFVLLAVRVTQDAFLAAGDWALWFESIWRGALASAGLSATVGVTVSLLWERARPLRRGLRQTSASNAGSIAASD